MANPNPLPPECTVRGQVIAIFLCVAELGTGLPKEATSYAPIQSPVLNKMGAGRSLRPHSCYRIAVYQ
jgi:hypothetical protein